MAITRVWIEQGCIACDLCVDYCPQVFLVENGEDCVVREGADTWFEKKEEEIRQAAVDCPVEVIKLEDSEAEDSEEPRQESA